MSTIADVGGQMPKLPRIRLLICDDHRVLTDALAVLVGMDAGLHLVAHPFDRAAAAVAAVSRLNPDLVLMDVELPGGMNGIQATREIVAANPFTKVVLMSGSGDPDQLLVDAIGAGATGFLPKTESAPRILSALHAAAAGESLLDPETLARVLRRVGEAKSSRSLLDRRTARLTAREREILQRLSEGNTNNEIADQLFLSVHTVHTHVRNILMKLEVHSKLQAVALAVRGGAVTVQR